MVVSAASLNSAVSSAAGSSARGTWRRTDRSTSTSSAWSGSAATGGTAGGRASITRIAASAAIATPAAHTGRCGTGLDSKPVRMVCFYRPHFKRHRLRDLLESHLFGEAQQENRALSRRKLVHRRPYGLQLLARAELLLRRRVRQGLCGGCGVFPIRSAKQEET